MRKRSRILDCVRTYWAVRNDGYWREAVEMAQKMAVSHRKHMDSPPMGPIRLVKLGVRHGFGLKYLLTIRVKGENGSTTDYAVNVLRKPAGLPYQIKSFAKIAGTEIKGRISGGSKTSDDNKASSSKRGKKSVSPSKGQCSMLLRSSIKSEGSTELASGVLEMASTRLRARAFYMLLEQIRSEKPDLNYAKARKEASSMWGKLSEHEKMPFMDKAAKRLN